MVSSRFRRAATLLSTLRGRGRHGFDESSAPVGDYSEVFLEHYRRPRNLGDLDDPDAVAIVHHGACGDLMRLALVVDTDQGAPRIRQIRFKAYGCAATIAVASVITQMVTGRSVQEARGLRQEEVVEALGGLPPGRLHAALLGKEALVAALARL